MRDKINVVAVLLPDNTKTFGRKEDLDPIYWLLGAAAGWGGLPVQDVAYANAVPEKNDGSLRRSPESKCRDVTRHPASATLPVRALITAAGINTLHRSQRRLPKTGALYK